MCLFIFSASVSLFSKLDLRPAVFNKLFLPHPSDTLWSHAHHKPVVMGTVDLSSKELC